MVANPDAQCGASPASGNRERAMLDRVPRLLIEARNAHARQSALPSYVLPSYLWGTLMVGFGALLVGFVAMDFRSSTVLRGFGFGPRRAITGSGRSRSRIPSYFKP